MKIKPQRLSVVSHIHFDSFMQKTKTMGHLSFLHWDLSARPSVRLLPLRMRLFSFFSLLRCHNGGELDLDGGETGVIKCEQQAAMRRCHTYGVAMSLRRCRRMLWVLVFFLTNKGMLLVIQLEHYIQNTDRLTTTDAHSG